MKGDLQTWSVFEVKLRIWRKEVCLIDNYNTWRRMVTQYQTGCDIQKYSLEMKGKCDKFRMRWFYLNLGDKYVDCLFRSFVTIKSSNEIVTRRHRAVLNGRELRWLVDHLQGDALTSFLLLFWSRKRWQVWLGDKTNTALQGSETFCKVLLCFLIPNTFLILSS